MEDIVDDLENRAGETPQETGLDMALKITPNEEIKALFQFTSRYKMTPDDPWYGNIIAAKLAFSCAASAGQAAETVQASVQKIPDEIFNGAVHASQEVSQTIRDYGNRLADRLKGEVPQTFSNIICSQVQPKLEETVNQAGKDVIKDMVTEKDLLIQGLETVREKLITDLAQNKVDEYISAAKQKAMSDFHDEVREAANNKFRWQRNMHWGLAVAIVLFVVGIGWVGNLEYLKASGYITPTPIQRYSDGSRYCHQVDNEYVCVLTKAPGGED